MKTQKKSASSGQDMMYAWQLNDGFNLKGILLKLDINGLQRAEHAEGEYDKI